MLTDEDTAKAKELVQKLKDAVEAKETYER